MVPTLANYTWRRTTTRVETFAWTGGGPERGVFPTDRSEDVTTIQAASIIDAPQMPDPRSYVQTTVPWMPTDIIVKDGKSAGRREPVRSVILTGFHVKKDGTLGKIAQRANWHYMGQATGRGTLHAMPDWVRELVGQMEPADEGVLT